MFSGFRSLQITEDIITPLHYTVRVALWVELQPYKTHAAVSQLVN